MALAISSPVWVEITDPESHNTFYANLASGECNWSLPEGATIQHQSPAGEWWELFDDIHNLPYYYNTKTGQTEWERPQDSTHIISLTAIQKSVIGQRLSLHLSTGAAQAQQSRAAARRSVERLQIPSAPDATASIVFLSNAGLLSPAETPTEPSALCNAAGHRNSLSISEQIVLTPPKDSSSTISLGISRNLPDPESVSRPELSPPLSPTTGSGLKDISNWRSKPKHANSQQQQQSGPTLSTNSIVSTLQKAASMTLSRSSFASAQQIAVPSRSQSGVNSRPSIPLSASHPPTSGSSMTLNSCATFSGTSFQPARKSFQIAERARKFGIGAPIVNDEAARKMSPMIIEQQQEALRKMSTSPPQTPPKSSVRDGTHIVQPYHPRIGGSVFPPGTHPALPAELQSSISQFRIAGFAEKYFSTHKKGLFRRRVPMEKMLLHQKSPLSQPLMVFDKRGVQKDALRCFKIVQKLMGERKGNGYAGPTGIELGETCVDLSIQSEDDTKLVLELIKKGLDHGELRDEIYVQLCKQLTENPSREGSIKGWHLFTILLITFAPSKNLHEYLASFLTQHATTSLHPIPVMAQHCLDLLRRISKRGSRAKQLTLIEIARAQEAAFRPSVFEATLERLMGRQMASGGEWAAWRVPRLMVFLKESVISLGGHKTEGIFRISGDLGSVAELRARIELGNYDLEGITDPHVPCSLLRLWIRDLPEPIIPYGMYQQCIQGAEDKDAVARVISALPLWHKEMMIYLVSFLKTFNDPTVKEATKMSLANLAMVFAPTLLQCSSDDAPMLMGRLQAERVFVSTLISEVEFPEEDLRILGEIKDDR
ncbi:hypothetical protein BC939DRAFT_437941 [Gamsiella multidivaricata]|uniref:uncharacterized protein n=1 Tax=Gamsiella multidivaricata TaxID=101098 RepID=UPI00221F87A2|nr:uncharacterized protein BC939DRAFT_437941 [Gamsiella multidivaricata]KAI7831216.1 hypothetical protein BC939DRAFT_437941 [Gamsiella multidivaricata]